MKRSKKSIKKNLKDIVLNKNYDSMIYRIVDNGCLDFFIGEIDNIPVVNPVTNDSISANEQVVKLLDRLILLLKRDFIGTLPHQEFIIENIIMANQSKLSEYLKLKCCLDNSECNNLVIKKIYQIITSNFCKNVKYIPRLKRLFTKLGISLNIEDNSILLEIRRLLIDIINCNQKKYDAIYLFSDIKYSLDHKLINVKSKLESKQLSENIIDNYVDRYSNLLDDYFDKKKYLKIFE